MSERQQWRAPCVIEVFFCISSPSSSAQLGSHCTGECVSWYTTLRYPYQRLLAISDPLSFLFPTLSIFQSGLSYTFVCIIAGFSYYNASTAPIISTRLHRPASPRCKGRQVEPWSGVSCYPDRATCLDPDHLARPGDQMRLLSCSNVIEFGIASS